MRHCRFGETQVVNLMDYMSSVPAKPPPPVGSKLKASRPDPKLVFSKLNMACNVCQAYSPQPDAKKIRKAPGLSQGLFFSRNTVCE
jgi:hypothetical protein